MRNLSDHRVGTSRRGLTLVELMIAMSTLTVILGAVALATLEGNDAFRVGRMVTDLEVRAQRTVERIVKELRDAGRAGLNPEPLAPFGSSTLDFQRNLGFAGVVQWSDPRRIAFEYDAREANDGVDNNSNGLTDEGMVVWRENPGAANERRIVWTSWVRELLEGEIANGLDDNGNGLIDEAGLCFQVTGNTVVVRLTLERTADNGTTITRTVETAISLRN